MHLRILIVSSLLFAILAGCAGQAQKELSMAQSTAVTGSAFNKALYSEYLTIAERELAEADRENSMHFSSKATAAASGKAVGPDDFSTWKVHPEYEAELRDARAKLVAALNSPAAATNPVLAAKAQANFDCWMEECSEPWWQPADRALCRENFEKAMAGLAAAQPPASPSPKATAAESFLVFFDFDSAALTPEARDIVKTAADAAKKGSYKALLVTGHADRAGSAEYNLGLSRRRASTVAAELQRLGIPASEISIEAKGETEPLVPTADGVPEPQNRRVEMLMR